LKAKAVRKEVEGAVRMLAWRLDGEKAGKVIGLRKELTGL
jgi:hypothetical protein